MLLRTAWFYNHQHSYPSISWETVPFQLSLSHTFLIIFLISYLLLSNSFNVTPIHPSIPILAGSHHIGSNVMVGYGGIKKSGLKWLSWLYRVNARCSIEKLEGLAGPCQFSLDIWWINKTDQLGYCTVSLSFFLSFSHTLVLAIGLTLCVSVGQSAGLEYIKRAGWSVRVCYRVCNFMDHTA